jgi:hypothetical protein
MGVGLFISIFPMLSAGVLDFLKFRFPWASKINFLKFEDFLFLSYIFSATKHIRCFRNGKPKSQKKKKKKNLATEIYKKKLKKKKKKKGDRNRTTLFQKIRGKLILPGWSLESRSRTVCYPGSKQWLKLKSLCEVG